MTDEVEKGLAFIDSLCRQEQTAFLGLFAGCRFPWKSFDGRQPFMGKAECEWVDDWQDFYGRRLKDAGLFHFEASPARPNADGSLQVVEIDCGPTRLGLQVREAWWARFNRELDTEVKRTS